MAILREHEAGSPTADVCRKHGISSATFYKWKAKFGGLDVSDAKRLRALEDENAQAEEAAGRDDAGQRDPEGHQQPKVVTPAAQRQAVAHACAVHEVSERRACQTIGRGSLIDALSTRRAGDAAVRLRIRELAAQRRRFGYRRLHLLLTREGCHMNQKRFRRLYREEKLQVRKRGGRKRALGVRAPIALPNGPNERWSLDFVSDAFTDGRRFRILAIVDDFTRECLALIPDTSLSGTRVARELDALIARRGRPDELRLRQRPTSGSVASGAATDLAPLKVISGSRATSSKRLPPSRNELSAIANTGSLTRYIGPHRPQHEMQFQAEDPSIVYRVADAPSRHLLREVLPLGIGPSKKGR